MSEPRWVTKLVDLFVRLRRKRVKDGALFHELEQWRVPSEAIDEVGGKVKEKTKGYRNG